MGKMIQVTRGVLLTVRRPTGEIEHVENTQYAFGLIPPARYSALVAATRLAGRGEILSQSPLYKEVEDVVWTAGELAEQACYESRKAVERMSATGQ